MNRVLLKKIKNKFTKRPIINYEEHEFKQEQYSKDERIRFLEAKVDYLLDEASRLGSLVRYLVGEKIDKVPLFQQQTKDSFNFQWEHLPEGEAMLSNKEWKRDAANAICKRTDLPLEWFKGRKVLDAGCGQGRWSYGFGKLNVSSCVSFDISDNGIARTKEATKEFKDVFTVVKKNILEPMDLPNDFDLVWCFGVLHHTGNTYKGFQNLAKCVKPGGHIFLMLYAEPRRDAMSDYVYYHDIFDMRCKIKNLPFNEKIRRIKEKYTEEHLHGYFDAISPQINDLYRWDEIVEWLIKAGFEDIKRTFPEHNNHHVTARKRG